MFKRKNKSKKGIIAMAGAMAITGGLLAQATPAYAAAPGDSTTPVTYDNRQVLPDGNGEYGIIIPTAVSFTDTEATGNADLEIVGINGFELSNWDTLTVKASVKSGNEYKLKLNGTESDKYAKYSLRYNNDQDIPQSSAVTEITKRLGVGGESVAKIQGTANLGDKSKATQKGQYKDVLTYSFVEEANQKR